MEGLDTIVKVQVQDTQGPHGRPIHFKFGDYLQALDPQTGKPTSDPGKRDAWFGQQRIGEKRIGFSQVIFKHS